MVQAVFFDFDGVILDTADIKTEAFGELYRDHGPDFAARVQDYHVRHGGISRVVKIRVYEREWLGRPVDEAREAVLIQRYAGLVLDKVLAAPPLAGALETLDALQGRMPLFVVSATPQEELRHICDQRDLTRLFTEIHGSPRKKPEILSAACAAHGLEPAACLMVGDATTDQDAAAALGMPFVGIVPPGGRNLFLPGTRLRPDLVGLADLV